jgi:hypothetical protein
MKETPGWIVLSWGAAFAAAWFIRAHVLLMSVVCAVGMMSCLLAWGGWVLWRHVTGRDAFDDWPEDIREQWADRFPPTDHARRSVVRHARRDARHEPDPEAAEWFADLATGKVVDRNGWRVD